MIGNRGLHRKKGCCLKAMIQPYSTATLHHRDLKVGENVMDMMGYDDMICL
jgi:hypothetical protein